MSLPKLAPLIPYRKAIAGVPPTDLTEIDGQTVYARDLGSGPALLLLHGFASTTYSFRELFAALPGDFRLVGIDLNGFGQTQRPRPREAYRIEEQARLIVQVLESKGIGTAVVVGHSYGAAVATVLSESYPQRFPATILISPPSEFARKPPWYLRNALGTRAAIFLIRALLSNPRKFKDLSGKAVYVDGILTDEVAERYRKSMLVEGLEQACLGYAEAFARGTADSIRYENLTQPTLVISGEKDEVVSPESVREVAEKIPQSHLEVIPGCGHCPPEERPEKVVRAIRKFLETEEG